jgi:hypothetical protein
MEPFLNPEITFNSFRQDSGLSESSELLDRIDGYRVGHRVRRRAITRVRHHGASVAGRDEPLRRHVRRAPSGLRLHRVCA